MRFDIISTACALLAMPIMTVASPVQIPGDLQTRNAAVENSASATQPDVRYSCQIVYKGLWLAVKVRTAGYSVDKVAARINDKCGVASDQNTRELSSIAQQDPFEAGWDSLYTGRVDIGRRKCVEQAVIYQLDPSQVDITKPICEHHDLGV